MPVIKAEGAFDLVIGSTFAQLPDIFIESSSMSTVQKFCIRKNKSLLDVESHCYDIHGILNSKAVRFFEGKLLRMKEFLVISQHDN